MNTGNTGNTGNDTGTVVGFPQWLPTKEAAKRLGVSPRTLRHRASTGELSRRKVGRVAQYLVATPATPATPAIRNRQEYRQPLSDAGDTGNDTGNTGNDTREDDDRTHVLAELVDRVTTLAVEKGEAIAIGHRLADERDEMARQLSVALSAVESARVALAQSNDDIRSLHEVIDRLTDSVVEVSGSVLAAPIRGRLRAVLASA